LYFGEGEQLSVNKATDPSAEFSYISDPAKPVPHTSEVRMRFTPRPYMADDQRFATQRPDVLTFATEPLTDPLELSGEIVANLQVATSGTDADFIVKIIDVYPDTTSQDPNIPANIVLGGYQQMVRSEVMRARFRNSFSQPEPFVPNQKTKVSFSLQDVQHTIKPGHRLMVHIQSTWFPLIDRNPQKYVDNIFMADDEDFVKAEMTIFGDSYIEIGGDVEEPLHPEVVK
jgi:putative CocE/NonD family hydrolase